MKALLLTAVLGLVAALSLAQEEQDFSGTWYVKAVVMGRDMPEEMRSKQMSPVRVTALEGGDLEVTITFVKNNQCVQKKVLMQKTDEPGKFRTYDGKKLLYAQELPGTGHFVFYCDNRHQGKLFHMGQVPGPVVAVSSRHLLPAHLAVEIPLRTSRDSCRARGSWRRTSSRLHRRVRGRTAAPGPAPLEPTPLPDRAPRPLDLPLHH
uniref:Lipocalin/cytosolic fatty-acid binding domain-containing protein n=1 Tax=Microcebus murinus TaxID=30608 RepID=A0A8C5YBA3_MICMU